MPRRIGVEFEFTSRAVGDENLIDAFEHAVEVVRMSNILAGEPGICQVESDIEDTICWTVKADGSCGWEVTSPAFNDDPREIRQIGEILDQARIHLRELGCRSFVNSRCGMHIHIEARDMSQEHKLQVVQNCYAIEPAIFSVHPPSRRDNSYLYNLREEFSGQISSLPTDHETVVNYRGWAGPRFEFRHAAGTARSSKFVPWTLICLVFVLGSRSTALRRSDSSSVDVLVDAINQLDTGTEWLEAEKPGLIEWARERAESHSRNR